LVVAAEDMGCGADFGMVAEKVEVAGTEDVKLVATAEDGVPQGHRRASDHDDRAAGEQGA
jgi:hypothetical protein